MQKRKKNEEKEKGKTVSTMSQKTQQKRFIILLSNSIKVTLEFYFGFYLENYLNFEEKIN